MIAERADFFFFFPAGLVEIGGFFFFACCSSLVYRLCGGVVIESIGEDTGRAGECGLYRYVVSLRKASNPSRHLPIPCPESVLFKHRWTPRRYTSGVRSIREQVRELGATADDGR